MIRRADPSVAAEIASLPEYDGNMSHAVYCAVRVLERQGVRVTVDAVAARVLSTTEAVGPILVRLIEAGRLVVFLGSIYATTPKLAA
jgi:hypothetical protein